MKTVFIAAAFGLALALTSCVRKPAVRPFDIGAESLHTLVFQNKYVRVFEVQLPPQGSTAPHFHERPYYITGLPDQLRPDRSFPYIQLAGEERKADGSDPGTKGVYGASFVKGETLPFEPLPGPMVETNPLEIPIHYLEIELTHLSQRDLARAIEKRKFHRESRYHDAVPIPGGSVATFEDFFVLGRRIQLEPQRTLDRHHHAGNYMLIAASDLHLRLGTNRLALPEGQVKWMKHGDAPPVTNINTTAAFFTELELKPEPAFPEGGRF